MRFNGKQMKIKTLDDLYLESLRDMYSAETQLVKALKTSAKNSSSPQLEKAFNDHLAQTESQCASVKEIIESLGEKASGHVCEAMKGLIEEAEELIENSEEGEVRDAGLIAMAQKIEHYEIASYGTIVTFSKQLGKKDHAKKLQQILDQEYKANDLLTEIAEGSINEQAAAAKA
jgi:ferritin-like metal-binding protein YciE